MAFWISFIAKGFARWSSARCHARKDYSRSIEIDVYSGSRKMDLKKEMNIKGKSSWEEYSMPSKMMGDKTFLFVSLNFVKEGSVQITFLMIQVLDTDRLL